MNERQIRSILKSQLHSRMIGYDAFWFSTESVAIIIHLRSPKVSISLPYLVDLEAGEYIVSTFDKSWQANSVTQAVSMVVRHLRTQEVKYNKFSK